MFADQHDVASNILGWISIACWIVVYSPQIYENYTLKSGEGLSVAFVLIWLVGDITNLAGAILANLIPTVIVLALYYSFCDLVLLGQIYYYRWRRAPIQAGNDENEPLLDHQNSNIETNTDSTKLVMARYASALVFVLLTGCIAWLISEQIPTDDNPTPPKPPTKQVTYAIHILGWTSAMLFLGARIPQIIKNFSTRCDGLAPALFFFSIFGNTTYAASILAKSLDGGYLVKNSGWLAGSLLTVFLDLFVLGQFFYFRAEDRRKARNND